MDSLLKHMVDMTGHRDHRMLDISVISAIQELAGATETRVLAIAMRGGDRFLLPRAVVREGMEPKLEGEADPESVGEPVARYPVLVECLANHGASSQAEVEPGVFRLWTPIWIKEQANVCLEATRPTPFTKENQKVAEGIANVYRNFQNLLDYSERDSLTGLLNRKTFDDQLAVMLAPVPEDELSTLSNGAERRQHREEEKQWLAVIDVDHFKAVNDQFGHLYGDEVLILIANLMMSSFRSQDRVFRFGGEEFVVLLRSTTLENAGKIIERFRHNVESHSFPQVGRITVSVGFVSVSNFESPVVVLGHADQALYYAKSHGRNMVCHYAELVSNGQLHTEAVNDTADLFF